MQRPNPSKASLDARLANVLLGELVAPQRPRLTLRRLAHGTQPPIDGEYYASIEIIHEPPPPTYVEADDHTTPFSTFEPSDASFDVDVQDDTGTSQVIKISAPFERIELLELDLERIELLDVDPDPEDDEPAAQHWFTSPEDAAASATIVTMDAATSATMTTASASLPQTGGFVREYARNDDTWPTTVPTRTGMIVGLLVGALVIGSGVGFALLAL